MGMARLLLAAGIAVLWACSRPVNPVDPAGAAAKTKAKAGGQARYVADWGRMPSGLPPADWIDVVEDGHSYPWLYDGGWQVRRVGNSASLVVPLANVRMAEPLSFRRYDGDAFGAEGSLPERYRVVLEGRSMGGAQRFNGYGELASQVFYLTPKSYVEVLQTDTDFFIWQADNAAPMQGSGWKQLAKVPNAVKIGDWVRFGAEVDTVAGTVVALLNDRPVATASPSLMALGYKPRLTLRATGNREEWRVVEIHELPPGPASIPGAAASTSAAP